jgi:hypothetical protein
VIVHEILQLNDLASSDDISSFRFFMFFFGTLMQLTDFGLLEVGHIQVSLEL